MRTTLDSDLQNRMSCGCFCINNEWTYCDSHSEDSQNHDNHYSKQEKADRFNEGKLKWSLVDFKSLEPLVKVLESGAKKYSPHNWKKGLDDSEVMESLLRHAFCILNGEITDKESGEDHIGHIMANAMFLSYQQRGRNEKQP